MKIHPWKMAGMLFLIVQPISAQMLNYKTSALGNEDFKCPGPHMQNHINNMNVTKDGSCVTQSVWDEGGHTKGIYKNGKYVKDASYNANSQVATDNSNKTWTIVNYFGRFISQKTVGGGLGYLLNDYDYYVLPIPTGNKAPYIKCSDGRVITDIKDPSAIGINYKTGELLVADNGEDQNIKIYNLADVSDTLKYKATFGVKGGVWGGTNPGLMDNPLKFAGISGVGADSIGNIYVANSVVNKQEGGGGGSDLRAFKSDGTLLWKMRGVLFVASGCVDPSSNGTDIYTPYYHFKMDYSKPAGENWEIVSTTINPFKYPDDPRLINESEDGFAIKVINGKRYMWITDMYTNAVMVYRFDGETAVPCAAFCVAYGWNGDEHTRLNWHWNRNRPAMPRWLWCDRNGNGYGDDGEFETFDIGQFCDGLDVDNNGNFYLGAANSNVYKFPSNSFDKFGNPQYSSATMIKFANVGHEVHSMKWVEENDMFVCGNALGITSVDVYNDWSKPTRSKLYSVPIPQHQAGKSGDAGQVTADKDYFYITYKVQGGPKTGKEGEIDVFKLIDGSFVGYLTPGPEIGSCSGWIDMKTPTKAFCTYSGQRIITTEEDWVGKVIVYQWCPDGTCFSQCTKTVDSISILPAIQINGYGSDTLKVKVFPDTVCYPTVSWVSLNNKIATVDKFGTINSFGVGTAWIKAISVQQPEKSDSCLVTVTNVPVTSISFSDDTVKIAVSKNLKLSVNFIPSNSINRKILWLSTDNSIATIDSSGNVSALKVGNVKIIATSADGGFKDSCILKASPIPFTGFGFKRKKTGIWINDTISMEVIFQPADANNKILTWKSLSTDVASINETGVIKGLSLGVSKIVAITDDGNFSDTCEISVLSENQFASQDIGTVCVKGNLTLNNGLMTVSAGGADIWNAIDGFHFAYRKQTGDGVIIARVVSQSNTSEWAKAGVMMRESLDPDSKHANMIITPSNGTSFQRRTTTGGASDFTAKSDGKKAPYWVKLIRKGNLLTGYNSLNGRSWVKIDEVTILMNSNIYVGLCVTAHNDCQLNTSTFDNVIYSSNTDTVLDIPNTPPAVNITAPTNNTIIYRNTAITIKANSTDDVLVSRVEFYNNDTLIGTDNSSPFSISYTFTHEGLQKITAKAFDSDNASTVSAEIPVNILPTGIAIANKSEAIKIFPNPVKEILTVSVNCENIQIVNLSGTIILSDKGNCINVASLTPGIYFAIVNYKNSIKTIVFTKE